MSDTSGNLLADRRYAWAMGLLAEDDLAAAADLLTQVVEIVPGWAPGWQALGAVQERRGETEAALAAWGQVGRHDPEGRLGASLHLARLGGEVPGAMPPAYVRALFDDYAPRFDRHLVERLHYSGPAVLLAAIEAAAPGRRFARALDLGCGTGLMGVALKAAAPGGAGPAHRADRITGVDLSPRMVEAARRTGAYTALATGSLEETLAAAEPAAFDLVVAADVLVYVGDLRPVLAGAARVLAPGGLVAFTVQRATEPGADYMLGADLRFAHGEPFVQAALTMAGLACARVDPVSTRTENGRPVPGFAVVAGMAPA